MLLDGILPSAVSAFLKGVFDRRNRSLDKSPPYEICSQVARNLTRVKFVNLCTLNCPMAGDSCAVL